MLPETLETLGEITATNPSISVCLQLHSVTEYTLCFCYYSTARIL